MYKSKWWIIIKRPQDQAGGGWGTFSSLISPSSCTISSRRLSCSADMRRSSSSFLCLDDTTAQRQDASSPALVLGSQRSGACWVYSMRCFLFSVLFMEYVFSVSLARLLLCALGSTALWSRFYVLCSVFYGIWSYLMIWQTIWTVF